MTLSSYANPLMKKRKKRKKVISSTLKFYQGRLFYSFAVLVGLFCWWGASIASCGGRTKRIAKEKWTSKDK